MRRIFTAGRAGGERWCAACRGGMKCGVIHIFRSISHKSWLMPGPLSWTWSLPNIAPVLPLQSILSRGSHRISHDLIHMLQNSYYSCYIFTRDASDLPQPCSACRRSSIGNLGNEDVWIRESNG